ncbi:MAG: phosphodiester glycosidase family protein [Anaerolineaceae bacterium]|nr:phosphodiester glycosidase family protein [Anaerolineaceae bacterium]
MNVENMMSILRDETIRTWFDLGLFIDRLKENREQTAAHFSGSYDDFLKSLCDGGIAFITFDYSIGGASTEIEKYAKSFYSIFGAFPLHYVGGKFHEKGELLIPPGVRRFQLDELASFDDWSLYEYFFYKRLERGNEAYNDLIIKFWTEVLVIAEKLGHYIEDNHIQLLYLINTNSNPGNISLALAIVFISEIMGIPVINNNHDFYWEGGHSGIDIQIKGVKPGPRDHFFKNHHLGEVFSILEMIYPWESRIWLSVNINKIQCETLINEHGHNPANITQIGTAIEFEKFTTIIGEAEKKEVLHQLSAIFGNYGTQVSVSSVSNLLKRKMESFHELSPMLIGAEEMEDINFETNNVILLQPTRIISRKSIEVNFTLVKKLIGDVDFLAFLERGKDRKVTLLITGPIATGHFGYFLEILEHFYDLVTNLDPDVRNRIFLGFLFSEFDKPSFKERFKNPVGIGEMYRVASLVVLPSETEGRGLPIIEAAAAGVPMFCRRFAPDAAYAKVIGEHLPRKDCIKNLEFTDTDLPPEVIEAVKQRILAPSDYEKELIHNQRAVEKRYSPPALKKDFERILHQLFLQVTSGPESYQLASGALNDYKKHIAENKRFAQSIISTKNRQYLPGYGQLAYMLFLKSLIDPSYFRVEEKRFRGMAMQFAKELVDSNPDPAPLALEVIHHFYNSVDAIFLIREGEIPIRMDHSFAYRHRNKNYYPYRDLTLQELTGVISILYNKIASPPLTTRIEKNEASSKDWSKNLSLLHKNSELAIDHTDELERKLNSNIPIAIFPGNQIELELELFVLYPVRKRLGLEEEDKITPRSLDMENLAPIFIIARNKPLGESITADVLKSYIQHNAHSELRLLIEHRVCKIVGSEQHSVGFHSYGVGQEVCTVLTQVKKEEGIIITIGDDAAIMTDIVDLDRFHIGKVSDILVSKMMGIPYGNGYIQWVPPGLRFALSYPTPVQTGKDFSKALKSSQYKKLCDSLGEKKVLQILRIDAEEKGTPIRNVLRDLDHSIHEKSEVSYSHINGIYSEGLPWAGVFAKINMRHSKKKWQFSVMSTADRPKTVLNFVEDFNKTTGRNAKVAWNGGYIINPELVGKLGIPEKFIGSPLGLIISNNKVHSPPLFNKPAFIVLPDGTIEIRRVNSSNGITISDSSNRIEFSPDTYNPKYQLNTPCYYDLLFLDDQLEGNGRILVRLSGHTIIDIIHTTENEIVPVLPVGLTLSFPKDQFPKTWEMDMELTIKMNGWEEIDSAIEAGPQLLKGGEVCIDMELEGWKTQNSIKTQAARLDYLDSRGPKIAVGIDKTGDLTVLSINGRIRESVGATHGEMAEILKTHGMEYAMGFDPGGSSTLVVDNKVLNISPYNSEYEKDIYSLPPEPRAIANALIVSET